jgi:hypothetical protein
VNISTPAPAAAKPKTTAESYGGFYTKSPNGEKLAELRKQNEAMVKPKLAVTG